jgi:hypothetical protein
MKGPTFEDVVSTGPGNGTPKHAKIPCFSDPVDDGYERRPEKDPDKVLSSNQSAGNELARACESELTQAANCMLVAEFQVDVCTLEMPECSLIVQEGTVVVREPTPDMSCKFSGELITARVRALVPECAGLKLKELRPPSLSDKLIWPRMTLISVLEEIPASPSQVPAKIAEEMTREHIAKRAKASGPSTPLDGESIRSFETNIDKAEGIVPASPVSNDEREVEILTLKPRDLKHKTSCWPQAIQVSNDISRLEFEKERVRTNVPDPPARLLVPQEVVDASNRRDRDNAELLDVGYGLGDSASVIVPAPKTLDLRGVIAQDVPYGRRKPKTKFRTEYTHQQCLQVQ